MLVLNPRHIGADMNLDKIQFFIDYCNSAILSGSFITTAYLPTFKLIALGMQVEIVDVNNPEQTVNRDATLNPTEKAFVEKLFTSQGWICSFTTRSALQSLIEKANDESKDILLKLMVRFKSDFTEDIFYLSTFAFKEYDPEEEARKAAIIAQNQLLASGQETTAVSE